MNNLDLNNSDSEDDFDFKKEIFKYLYFWKFILLSLVICFSIAFLYLRYNNKIFETVAKVKILDKKDSALELPSAEDLFSSSKINLENELETIKSYPILDKVIRNQNLTTSVIHIANVKTKLVLH